MQENKLTEAQSLELITSMINDSRTRLAHNSGTPFLIWGYTTVTVSLLVYFMTSYKLQNAAPHEWYVPAWLWLAIPIVGWIGMLIFGKHKQQGAQNLIDRVISIIWTVLGISFLWIMVVGVFYHTPILFLTIIMCGIGTTMTGYIIRNKATKICGIVAMISSILFPISRWLMVRFIELHDNITRAEWINCETLLFAAIFLFMMVIPGHILNHKYNNK